jgi:hypothetical protein
MSLWAKRGERGKCRECEEWRRINGSRIGHCNIWKSIEFGSYSCYRWMRREMEKMEEISPANEDCPEDAG